MSLGMIQSKKKNRWYKRENEVNCRGQVPEKALEDVIRSTVNKMTLGERKDSSSILTEGKTDYMGLETGWWNWW